jgi:hypothetical protein
MITYNWTPNMMIGMIEIPQYLALTSSLHQMISMALWSFLVILENSIKI